MKPLSYKGPSLKRADSLPARLPSSPAQAAEVKPVRNPITRPVADTMPPTDLRDHIQGGMHVAADLKCRFVKALDMRYMQEDVWVKIAANPEYRDILNSVHPNYNSYSMEQQIAACDKMAFSHPRLLAEMAAVRNDYNTVPNYPTASRTMNPDEQKFLTDAFKWIHHDIQRKPFHMHGESAVIGNEKGEVIHLDHSPSGEVSSIIVKGDKYHLHTHPPFMEPFTSSASEMDHVAAAQNYLAFGNEMNTYVTNGKDVLHIHPASLDLVKLNPDPKMEETLGKFPEAFRVPDPQQPPRPFSNHESPAAFKADWEPPAGWKPPERFWDPPKHISDPS